MSQLEREQQKRGRKNALKTEEKKKKKLKSQTSLQLLQLPLNKKITPCTNITVQFAALLVTTFDSH